jgi:hypothetical protein
MARGNTVKPSGKMKNWLDAGKTETRVLSAIERHLLARKPSSRSFDTWLHPSEMAKSDWCPRASYYRITGSTLLSTKDMNPSFRLETIFGEGHAIHEKWQRWLGDVGLLAGRWECRDPHCAWSFYATSAKVCERCDMDTPIYREVPVVGEHYNIRGHADGEIKDAKGSAILEIKSVGLGTLRFEQPELIRRHGSDIDAIWKDIRTPFPSHLRQTNIYMALTGIKETLFIYEFKPNQAVKEFATKYSPGIAEPLLDAALDVKYAVKSGNPPSCPKGGCSDCKRYEVAEHSIDADGDNSESTSPNQENGLGVSGSAGGGDAPITETTIDDNGRSTDGVVRPVRSLGRLLERATSASRD